MSTEQPIKNKHVQKRIADAFTLMKAVNDLNLAQARGGKVDRALVERVVHLAYGDVHPILQVFLEKDVKRAIDDIEESLNNKA